MELAVAASFNELQERSCLATELATRRKTLAVESARLLAEQAKAQKTAKAAEKAATAGLAKTARAEKAVADELKRKQRIETAFESNAKKQRLEALESHNGKRGSRFWDSDQQWYPVEVKRPRKSGPMIFQSEILFAPDLKQREYINLEEELAANRFKWTNEE